MATPQPLIKNEIRLDLIFKIIWNRRKRFILPLAATAVIAYALVCCIPRTYSVSVKLAPEYDNGSGGGGGTMASLASMMDINIGGGSDAIVPKFYPDLMKSTDFIVPLLDVRVATIDGRFKGTFEEYLRTQSKAPWWSKLLAMLKSKPGNASGGTKKINPFSMTKEQMQLVQAASGAVSCETDDKTDVITITTTSQDPLVAALLADSIKTRLQAFITDYRTKKARGELKHLQEVMAETHRDYIKKQKEYAAYADSHQDVVLAEYRVKLENLENELQMAYNAYSSAKSQETVAQAKLLSRTPAFTTLQNATVPLRPAGPKRMAFTLLMVIFAFVGTSIWCIAKYKRTGDDGSRPAPCMDGETVTSAETDGQEVES